MAVIDGKIRTGRLVIRTMCEDDWRWNQEIWHDFNRSVYAPYDRELPEEDAAVQELTKKFSESGLFFSVFLPDSGDMIGYICFHQCGAEYDLGYCFHSAYQGKGYALESAKAVIAYLTETRGAVHFTAATALDNKPSCRLLDRLGFACASTETVSFDGKFSFLGGNFIMTVPQ